MKFIIDEEIIKKFPELNLGIIIAKGLDNNGENKEVINLLKKVQDEVKENYQKDKLIENLKFAVWRKAYSSFGAKPSKYKCSVENLYRMILDGINLRHINKLVDIYNYISIKNIIPVGGDDLDKIDGDITLKFAKGDEEFKALNSNEIKNPLSGEVVYADDKEILCRRWNWRECDKSKMTEDTKNVCMVIEGLSSFKKEEINKILEEFSKIVKIYCKGELSTHVLNKENTVLEI